MTRKDTEKDSERPHYYSQFWLDVAAGRRIIGTPKPNEEGDIEERSEPTPPPPSRGRSNDGYAENIVHPVADPIDAEAHEYRDSGSKKFEQDDDDDLESDETYQVEDDDIPDIMEEDAEDAEDSEDGDGEYYDDEEEEGDDDVDWGRGRKKTKPTRPVKPVVKKPGKRDTRRNF